MFDRAIEDLDIAVRLDPSNRDALTSRGMSHLARWDLARAVADFDAASRATPTTAEPFLGRGLVRLLHHQIEHAGRHDEAAAHWDEVIRLTSLALGRHPRHRGSLSLRCLARAMLGDVPRAIEDCDAALAIHRSAPPLALRALARARGGDVRGALADYDAAVAVYPAYPVALYGRSWARRKLGDIAAGDRDIASVAARRPDVVKEMRALGLE
jgi:tetratricopeptide (TPR) repeat protein